MAEHYTKNTVFVTLWCGKCGCMTEHNVYGGRRGPCAVCFKKLEDAAAARKTEAPAAKQTNLFAAEHRQITEGETL